MQQRAQMTMGQQQWRQQLGEQARRSLGGRSGWMTCCTATPMPRSPLACQKVRMLQFVMQPDQACLCALLAQRTDVPICRNLRCPLLEPHILLLQGMACSLAWHWASDRLQHGGCPGSLVQPGCHLPACRGRRCGRTYSSSSHG